MTSTVASLLFMVLSLAACDTAEDAFEAHSQRAQQYLEQGNLDKARVELKSALTMDNSSVSTLLALADIAEQRGELRAAAVYFTHVLELSSSNVDASIGLARIQVLANNAEESLALTRRVLDKDPEHVKALTTHASALILQGQFGSALVSVNRALRFMPDDEEGLILLAWLLQNSRQYDAALETLQKAVELKPDSVRLIRNYAQLALFMNRHELAIAAHQRLLELLPNDPEQAYQMARLLLHLNRAEEAENAMRERLMLVPEDLDASLLLTEALIEQDRSDEAKEQVQLLLDTRKGLPELALLIADLYERTGSSQQAIDAYREAASTRKNSPVGAAAMVNVVRLFLARGERDAARHSLDKLMSEHPGNVDAQTLSGYLHLKDGDYTQAIAELRQAWRGGNASVVTTMLATALWRNNEQEAAIELLQTAPYAVRSQYLLAMYLRERGDVEGAKNITAKLIATHPDFIGAFELRARLALDSGNWEQASTAGAHIITRWPDKALGYYLLAEASIGIEAQSTAEAHLRRALEISPTGVEPLVRLFDLLTESKRYSEAVGLVKSVLDRDPEHVLAHVMLGRALIRQEKTLDAEHAFKSAAALMPQWHEPWRWLMRIASAQGDNNKVAEVVREARQNSDGAMIDQIYAELLVQEGARQDAMTIYRNILSRDPQSLLSINNLAMLLIQDPMDRAAVSEARDLMARIDPKDNHSALDTVGQVALASCEFSQAVLAHGRALKLHPTSNAYRMRLASAYLANGDSQRARTVLDSRDETKSQQQFEMARRAANRWVASCQPINQETHS